MGSLTRALAAHIDTQGTDVDEDLTIIIRSLVPLFTSTYGCLKEDYAHTAKPVLSGRSKKDQK